MYYNKINSFTSFEVILHPKAIVILEVNRRLHCIASFQIMVEKSMQMAYNMLNRTAGR